MHFYPSYTWACRDFGGPCRVCRQRLGLSPRLRTPVSMVHIAQPSCCQHVNVKRPPYSRLLDHKGRPWPIVCPIEGFALNVLLESGV